MKVLLATDGSASAEVAVKLAAGLAWPVDTIIRIVTTLDTVRLAGPWATMTSYGLEDMEQSLLEELEAVLASAAAELAASGVTVQRQVLLGRPSAAIAEQAAEMHADLIVVGNRGQGPFRTMLLGSVSAEVVDHAPCPVLVARRASLERILLAHDGSDLALAAEELLTSLPPLAASPVEVMSVVRTHEPSADALAPAVLGRAREVYASAVEDARRHHEEVARASADRLGRHGRTSTWSVRAGDPARILVDEAEGKGVDLIALGTHGRTGLDRLVMGSVARNVLTHAHCSVLVVRAGTGPVDAVGHAA